MINFQHIFLRIKHAEVQQTNKHDFKLFFTDGSRCHNFENEGSNIKEISADINKVPTDVAISCQCYPITHA
jgi:hypothetical protein